MAKSEVYSWRVAPAMKSALEDLARREGRSVGALLDEIVGGWIDDTRRNGLDDTGAQARLHAHVAKTLGRIRGGDPRRSERVRSAVRDRLTRRRAR